MSLLNKKKINNFKKFKQQYRYCEKNRINGKIRIERK